MSADADLPPSPRLAPLLERSDSRQVCLIDQPDRLTPWLALPQTPMSGGARIDVSLRPVTFRPNAADHPASRPLSHTMSHPMSHTMSHTQGHPMNHPPGLEAFASAYDAAALMSIGMLRKRPQERFSQARRIAFWELGRELMGLETDLQWSAPWLLAFWVPQDCRLEGLWLLELDIQSVPRIA